MYLEEPAKYENTFYIRLADFEIRIDDIQHSVMGYLKYKEHMDKINYYLDNIEEDV